MVLKVAGVPVPAEFLALGIPVGMALVVAALLIVVEPRVTRGVMLAFTPWMVTGAAVHALYTVDAYPEWADPLFDPVAVYFTLFTAAGMVWAYMATASRISPEGTHDAQYVAAAGVGATLVSAGFVLSRGRGADLPAVVPAFGGLVVAAVLAVAAYVLVGYFHSRMFVNTGVLGWVVVFAHALDGVMTAVAADVYGLFPLYGAGARLYSLAGTLPVPEVVGQGWLLVLVKVALAVVVVSGVASLRSRESVVARPAVSYLSLAAVAAYGLGPGVHILLTLVLFQ